MIVAVTTPRSTAPTANGSDLERHERSGSPPVELDSQRVPDIEHARAWILTDAADRDALTGPDDPLAAMVADLTGHRVETVAAGPFIYTVRPR